MSAKLMGQVWELDLQHGEQLVMLALADHGEDDGTQIYPSVARLAWKTGYKERQVQNILRTLTDKGLIEPVANALGGRGLATEYKINIEKGAKKTPFVKGAKSERVQSSTQKGAISDVKGAKSNTKGAIAIAPQPSEKHQLETSIEPSVRVAADAAPPVKPSKPTLKIAKRVDPEPPTKPKEPTPHQALVGVIAKASFLDLGIARNKGRVVKAAGELGTAGATPEQVEQHYIGLQSWWFTQCDHWAAKKRQRPTPEFICETWEWWNSIIPSVTGNGSPKQSRGSAAAAMDESAAAIAAFKAEMGLTEDGNHGNVINGYARNRNTLPRLPGSVSR